MGRAVFLLFVLLLAGCGFQLRGAVALPFQSVYIEGGGADFKRSMELAIRTGSSTKVVDAPSQAEATLRILSAAPEKRILALGGSGRVREYQLYYRVNFTVTTKTGTLLQPQLIELRRDMSYDDALALAKEEEEGLLFKNMRDDAVYQVLRRLAAIKSGGAVAPPVGAAASGGGYAR